MKTKFLDTIKKYSMCNSNSVVLVAVSGGADSMCLLNLFLMASQELDIRIEVAHVNHGIRGDEADRDEAFVREFCNSVDVPFHCLHTDIPAIASETSESIELCARRIRYEYFETLKCDYIATAHSGSDRIETMLMNLSRGAGLNGICSIPPVRGRIIRPLINFTRSEIESFCKDNSISYVTDSTNLCDDYTRNKFRHNVVSELIRINPFFETNALKCIERLNEDNTYISDVSNDCFNSCLLDDRSLKTDNLRMYDDVIIRRVIKLFFDINEVKDYEAKHIEYVFNNLNDEFSLVLPGNRKLSCKKDRLFFETENKDVIIPDTFLSLNDNIFLKLSDKTVIIRKSSQLPDKSEGFFAVNASEISESICVRSRKPGDVIHLGKRRCTKKLKKLFNEMNIPVEKRNSLIIISDEKGIIFVEGVGIDASRHLCVNSDEFILIKVEACDNE